MSKHDMPGTGFAGIIAKVAKIPAFGLLLLLVLPPAAFAQEPGSSSLPEIMKLHAQAEEVFDREDYERAMFIYRNELVPLGDKIAQYRVGYMFAAGKGVQRDGIEASAWFRLAAERGNKQFVKISNQVLESMTPAQRQLSDSVYLPLRQQFSDVAILLNSARADYDSLQAQTTTTGGDIMVSNLRPESPVANRNSAKHYRDLEKQMNSKLGQVADELGIKKSSIDYDEPDWQMLNDQVVEHLNKLD